MPDDPFTLQQADQACTDYSLDGYSLTTTNRCNPL